MDDNLLITIPGQTRDCWNHEHKTVRILHPRTDMKLHPIHAAIYDPRTENSLLLLRDRQYLLLQSWSPMWGGY